LDFKAITL